MGQADTRIQKSRDGLVADACAPVGAEAPADPGEPPRGIPRGRGATVQNDDGNAPETLRHMLRQILREIKVVPENAQYRVSVEMMAKERLAVVEKDISPEQMEDEIGCGQLEELILHAQDELSLIP